MDTWNNDRWNDTIRAVFRKAMFDRTFRSLAITDPQAALAQVTDQPLPSGLKIRFVESLEEQVLVLPSVVVGQGGLSEIDISRMLFHATKNQAMTPVLAAPEPVRPAPPTPAAAAVLPPAPQPAPPAAPRRFFGLLPARDRSA